ncbi:TPA: hypothetical protein R4126_003788 [Klebsiella michiganensis]|nr:hypothetical protein [Klebsiella michiganensis]
MNITSIFQHPAGEEARKALFREKDSGLEGKALNIDLTKRAQKGLCHVLCHLIPGVDRKSGSQLEDQMQAIYEWLSVVNTLLSISLLEDEK